MNPQQQAFVEHLDAHEDDLATRLIYSDWLEEHDQPEEALRMRLWPAAKEQMIALGNTYINEWDEVDSPLTLANLLEVGTTYRDQGQASCISGQGFTAEGNWSDHPEFAVKYWELWQVLTGLPLPAAYHEAPEVYCPFKCCY